MAIILTKRGSGAAFTEDERRAAQAYRFRVLHGSTGLATPWVSFDESGLTQVPPNLTATIPMEGVVWDKGQIHLQMVQSLSHTRWPTKGDARHGSSIIPQGGLNPFRGRTRPPDYVINELTVYATTEVIQAGVMAAARQAASMPRGLIAVARWPEGMAYWPEDYAVVVVPAGRPVPEGVPDAPTRRAHHIALIEWPETGMSIAQLVENALWQWEDRQPAQTGGAKTRFESLQGVLGAYL